MEVMMEVIECLKSGFVAGLSLAIATGGIAWGILITYNQFKMIIGG